MERSRQCISGNPDNFTVSRSYEYELERLVAVIVIFKKLSPNYISHPMISFVSSLITILVVMMMRMRWTVIIIWNILRMLLTI